MRTATAVKINWLNPTERLLAPPSISLPLTHDIFVTFLPNRGVRWRGGLQYRLWVEARFWTKKAIIGDFKTAGQTRLPIAHFSHFLPVCQGVFCNTPLTVTMTPPGGAFKKNAFSWRSKFYLDRDPKCRSIDFSLISSQGFFLPNEVAGLYLVLKGLTRFRMFYRNREVDQAAILPVCRRTSMLAF